QIRGLGKFTKMLKKYIISVAFGPHKTNVVRRYDIRKKTRAFDFYPIFKNSYLYIPLYIIVSVNYRIRNGFFCAFSRKWSMRAREMLIFPGISGMSSALNHPASRISLLSTLMSPPAYSAVKPIIRESGNGQGWLPKYRIFLTSMPASSLTSRRTAAYTV